jgi:hypothetical protein
MRKLGDHDQFTKFSLIALLQDHMSSLNLKNARIYGSIVEAHGKVFKRI